MGDQSSIGSRPDAYLAVEATGAAHVIPGHGGPTTPARARAETCDYTMNLRAEIGVLIDAGGDIIVAPEVDRFAFAHLVEFASLAGRNARTAFQQMEWE